MSDRFLCAFTETYNALRATPAGADYNPLMLEKCYWRRSVRQCHPASLVTEGCKRSLTVVPRGAHGIFSRDIQLYAERQPCVQLLTASTGSRDLLPDLSAMRRIEALVSIDMRHEGVAPASRLLRHTVNQLTTVDFAFVTVLRPVIKSCTPCCKAYDNSVPSLAAGPRLSRDELTHFERIIAGYYSP